MSRLHWYLNRARSMRPPEIVHRLKEQSKIARLSWRPLSTEELAWRPRFDTDLLESMYAKAETAVGDAESIVFAGELDLLGHPLTLPRPEWYRDPTGYEWPDAPWQKINFRHTDRDAKFIWEVHRLQYLVPLAVLSPRTQDPEASSALVRSVLEHWASSTRVFRGVAWASGIEVALRSLSLTVLASLTHLSLPMSTLTRIREECAAALSYLRTFPSLYSSANNHRVAELVALLVVGESWERPAGISAEQELAKVAESLIGADGAPLEQSSTYAAFTLELLAVAGRFTRWRDPRAHAQVLDVLKRGASFLAEFSDPRAGLFGYGDDDQSRVLAVGIGQAAWLSVLGELLGSRISHSGTGLRVFADGGVSIGRTDTELAVTFHHGPLGFGDIAAHGHLDQLHVSVYHCGVPLIVDPGTFRYHGDDEWRDYFRKAEAHNGPRVEGDLIAEPTGAFNWAPHRPKTRLVSAEVGPSSVTVTAESRSGLSPHHLTRRTLSLDHESLRILDSGSRTEVVLSRFVVHPAWTLEVSNRQVVVSRPDVSVRLLLDVKAGDLKVLPRAAWVSESYGTKRPATVVEVRGHGPAANEIRLSLQRFRAHGGNQ